MTEHAPDRTPGRPAARATGQEDTATPEERTGTDGVTGSATPARSPEDRPEGRPGPDAAELEDRWLQKVYIINKAKKMRLYYKT